MKHRFPPLLTVLLLGSTVHAAPLLAPGDFILPFDEDFSSNSNYPANETPSNAIDQNTTTKYLNFGEEASGFIVTPTAGATTVQSFVMTSANDGAVRDPSTWEIYGTNDAITSADNSAGNSENWTLIAAGSVALPDLRGAAAPVVGFANAVAYTSYRFVVTTVKDALAANSMQFAEIQFFPAMDGTGTPIFAPGDPILAIQLPTFESESPGAEGVENILDGDTATKHLNFGRENSGFIITPAGGPSVVTGFTMSTANDGEERDPVDWELMGTNDPITSLPHGTGLEENWTTIASGTLALPAARLTAGDPVVFANAMAYTSYRFVVRTVKNAPAVANSTQYSDVQFEGEFGPAVLLEITAFAYDQPNDMFTITWRSAPDRLYGIYYSTDLTSFGADIDDGYASGGETTTIEFMNPLPENPELFFRIEDNGAMP